MAASPALSPQIVTLLACPCPRHEALTVTDDERGLRCSGCSTSFPVREGIPVLLLDEAQPGPDGIGG